MRTSNPYKMSRTLSAILMLTVVCFYCEAWKGIVVDSLSHQPLASASLFDHNGNVLGMTDLKGRIPYLPPASFPVSVRYLGYNETIVEAAVDTVFMTESKFELPEVYVESKQHKILHILAYVREYSTLSTYKDSVFLFREKMVDYMLAPAEKVNFRNRLQPRVLKSKSYYRFFNSQGLDSVSNTCRNFFSWSDWVGIVPTPSMPESIRNAENATDTIKRKYSPAEIWTRTPDHVTVDVNVLADTVSRKWVHNLSSFFNKDTEFENFRLRYNYSNVVGDSIYPIDLAGYSFNIDSNGRGRKMFMFNSRYEPFFVSTFAEVYITDKEFITVKEARKWQDMDFDVSQLEIIEPENAPELQESILSLIDRVNSVDNAQVRIDSPVDLKLKGRGVRKCRNFAQRAFTMLKNLTGITSYKFHKNNKQNWNRIKEERKQRNRDKVKSMDKP